MIQVKTESIKIIRKIIRFAKQQVLLHVLFSAALQETHARKETVLEKVTNKVKTLKLMPSPTNVTILLL